LIRFSLESRAYDPTIISSIAATYGSIYHHIP
jgi:hypothetical protein